MSAISRTQKSLTNIYIALLYTLLSLILGFFSRKIFIEHLGADIVGLTTTATSLLGFLNLAELGIGGAVAFTLYKPLASNDNQALREIIAIQGYWYKRIASFILVAAAVLCCFFPYIFGKSNLPLWNAYACFAVLLFSSLLGYFFNYKQIILSASQQQYKITNALQGIRSFKVISQILGLFLLNYGYIYWLCLEVLAAIVSCYTLNYIIFKNFPFLKMNIKITPQLHKKYDVIKVKTKQILFHNIGSFILGHTSPLVIYAFLSLATVAIYGNYMHLFSALLVISHALSSGLTASVGNLVVSGNQSRIIIFFKELLSSIYCISSMFCLSLYLLATPFISIWFGSEYIMSDTNVMILVFYTFLQLTRACLVFIQAYGLFDDIWAPPVEATLNLGLSILLGYYFGLTGILLGIAISLFVIIFCWKPYYLFARGFKEPFYHYVKILFKSLLLIAISWGGCYLCLHFLYAEPSSIYQWFWEAFKCFSITCIVHVSVFYFCNDDFARLTKHLTKHIRQRFIKSSQ